MKLNVKVLSSFEGKLPIHEGTVDNLFHITRVPKGFFTEPVPLIDHTYQDKFMDFPTFGELREHLHYQNKNKYTKVVDLNVCGCYTYIIEKVEERT